MKYQKYILCGVLIFGAAIMAVPYFYQLYGWIQTHQLIKAFDSHIAQIQDDDNDLSTGSAKEAEIGTAGDGIPEFQSGVIGMIEIKSIDIRYPIMEGEGKAQLSHSVGHLSDTAGIGEQGNCVLAGHRGSRYGPIFKHLDQVKPGDEVQVTDQEGGVHYYWISEAFVTTPDDVSVKRQDRGEELTLVTCEYKGTMRLIVRCLPGEGVNQWSGHTSWEP